MSRRRRAALFNTKPVLPLFAIQRYTHQRTMCRFGSFKCVRLKSDADSSKFSFFFSHSKKLSVSDFTRTHFLIFEKNAFSNSKFHKCSVLMTLYSIQSHPGLLCIEYRVIANDSVSNTEQSRMTLYLIHYSSRCCPIRNRHS